MLGYLDFASSAGVCGEQLLRRTLPATKTSVGCGGAGGCGDPPAWRPRPRDPRPHDGARGLSTGHEIP
ncbi:hypothetical protein MTO96_048744 [Rhipicephalus appendiculatus]